MEFTEVLYLLSGTIISLFLLLLFISIIKEKKTYPAIKILILLVFFADYWFGINLIYHSSIFQIINISLALVFIILFFIPFGKRNIIKTHAEYVKAERVDERDTMFARSKLREGTDEYIEYYKMRPENKITDDKIRAMPELLSPGGKFYNTIRAKFIESLFKIEKSRINEVDGDVSPDKISISPEEANKMIKQFTLQLGADEVGIAELNPNYIYSHTAIGVNPWGSEIKNNHKFVIVYTLEMDYFKVQNAPEMAITEESANQYLNAQKISIALAQFIRDMGYPAKAHISGSDYDIMLPPVAYDAGLGELGRMNYLISKKYGGRARLGAVTTDLPLFPDKPISLGVHDFCSKCRKCADNCPSGAISKDNETEIRGANKWELNVEKCYRYWRIAGTDCGICMKVCPFSHPNNFVHNIFRKAVKNSSFARQTALWGDDFIYGKKVMLNNKLKIS
jgi:reductive dehalogenase